jgi:hypothetical protein
VCAYRWRDREPADLENQVRKGPKEGNLTWTVGLATWRFLGLVEKRSPWRDGMAVGMSGELETAGFSK